MAKVFISYRRSDAKWPAREVHRALTQVLPLKNIFMDIDSLQPCENFVQTLEGWVEQCDVLLALIGPGWANANDPATGVRRLDNVNDFVRIEIRKGLTRQIRVVPVLLDGAEMPTPAELPSDIRAVALLQAERADYRTLETDLHRLISKLRLDVGSPAAGTFGGGVRSDLGLRKTRGAFIEQSEFPISHFPFNIQIGSDIESFAARYDSMLQKADVQIPEYEDLELFTFKEAGFTLPSKLGWVSAENSYFLFFRRKLVIAHVYLTCPPENEHLLFDALDSRYRFGGGARYLQQNMHFWLTEQSLFMHFICAGHGLSSGQNMITAADCHYILQDFQLMVAGKSHSVGSCVALRPVLANVGAMIESPEFVAHVYPATQMADVSRQFLAFAINSIMQ